MQLDICRAMLTPEKERFVPVCVKTEFVDGEVIKEDTYYMLENGTFKECAQNDNE